MLKAKTNLHNRFDFEIYDTDTGVTEHAQAENIILNRAWERICGGSGIFSYIGIGTGTGTLSATRTSLFSPLLRKSAQNVESVYDTETSGHLTKKIIVSESEGIGVWTEIGIFYGNSDSSLCTHAMIMDSEGNTITINKTNTKIVTVYATIYATLGDQAPGYVFPSELKNNVAISNLLADGSGTTLAFKFSSMKKSNGGPSELFGFYALAATNNSDAANKRCYSNLTRLDTSVGNSPIRGIFITQKYAHNNKYCVGIGMPCSLYTGYMFANIAVGTGDGSTTQYDLPVSFPKVSSETIYKNGVALVRGTDYSMHYGMKSTETKIASINLADRINLGTGEIFEETIELPQPSNSEAMITKIEFKNSTIAYNEGCDSYDIKLSLDGITWVNAGSYGSGWYNNDPVILTSFPPAAYKYMRVKFTPKNASYPMVIWYFNVYATPPTSKHITFATPPAAGDAITATFDVEYIPKSSSFVLDVQGELIYGEGSNA